jgi:hypothetical protein
MEWTRDSILDEHPADSILGEHPADCIRVLIPCGPSTVWISELLNWDEVMYWLDGMYDILDFSCLTFVIEEGLGVDDENLSRKASPYRSS